MATDRGADESVETDGSDSDLRDNELVATHIGRAGSKRLDEDAPALTNGLDP
jgi:hypothetical protein